MFKDRTAIAVVGILAASLSLSACSAGNTDAGRESPPATSAESFNDQDVTFAQTMIQHHDQAIAMAQIILDKDGIDPKVIDLAEQIQAAQGPEIDQIQSWLTSWGAPAGGMDHGMDGMMSDDDMAALTTATGVEAGQLFLRQMIEHHQGAIAMAQMELDDGKNPEATALAQKIVDAQSTEIDLMEELLSAP